MGYFTECKFKHRKTYKIGSPMRIEKIKKCSYFADKSKKKPRRNEE
jgi:hypothetical protein